LKAGPQINISESVLNKLPGFACGVRICGKSGEQERIEKKYNNFGVLNSYGQFSRFLKRYWF